MADLTAAIISDVIRASLDDAKVRLGPRAERAVIERANELLALAGYRVVHSPTTCEACGHPIHHHYGTCVGEHHPCDVCDADEPPPVLDLDDVGRRRGSIFDRED